MALLEIYIIIKTPTTNTTPQTKQLLKSKQSEKNKVTYNKPTVYRETTQLKTTMGTNPTIVTIAAEFPEFVVEGGRVGGITETKLQDALNSANGQNDVFVRR